jgi:hypothetical protein
VTRALSWALPLLTAAVYGWLVLGPGAEVQRLAGGLAPFDLRPLGYDLAAARAFLTALPPQGAALYLGEVGRLDTVFPVFMGLTLLWWMRPLSAAFGIVCVLATGAYVSLDLLENRAVAGLVIAGPAALDPEAVHAASLLTRAKFMAFALAAVLAARASWLRWRV